MDAELSRIISQGGPIKTTSIGRVMYDVRTCVCGAGNTPTTSLGALSGQWSMQGVVIAALRERRALGESYRRLVNADVPAPPSTVIDNSSTYLAQINDFRVEHGQQPYRVREPSGPAIPRDQAMAQARAALERERRTPEGGIIVPPGVAAEGAAAITAWVTSPAVLRRRSPPTPPACRMHPS